MAPKQPVEWEKPAPIDPATWPAVVARTYPGSQPVAMAAFAAEASMLLPYGFSATSQTYAPGSRSGASLFLVAMVVVIGLLIFWPIGLLVLGMAALWMANSKPVGVLSVTYTRVSG